MHVRERERESPDCRLLLLSLFLFLFFFFPRVVISLPFRKCNALVSSFFFSFSIPMGCNSRAFYFLIFLISPFSSSSSLCHAVSCVSGISADLIIQLQESVFFNMVYEHYFIIADEEKKRIKSYKSPQNAFCCFLFPVSLYPQTVARFYHFFFFASYCPISCVKKEAFFLFSFTDF